MKKSITTLFLSSTLICAETTYLNQIKQINSFKNDAGEIVKTEQVLTNLGETGKQQASAGIMGTSIFKLITINGDTGDSKVLDRVTVSSYLSEAKVTIQGPLADPYNANPNNAPNHVQRTQVGQGFSVNYTLSNLLPRAEGTPEAASSVLYEEKTYTYAANGTSVAAGTAPNQTIQKDLDKNGTVAIEGSALGLSGTDITKARGEKVFSIYMKPDEDNPEYKEHDSAKVIIWPISDGSLSGIDKSKVYSKVPTIGIDLIDLYPGSDTYLSITGGSLKEPLIYGSRKNTGDVPLSVQYQLTNLDKMLINDGSYKIQLLHTSPFETLIFGEITLKLSRTITIKGGIITSE